MVLIPNDSIRDVACVIAKSRIGAVTVLDQGRVTRGISAGRAGDAWSQVPAGLRAVFRSSKPTPLFV